MADFTALKTAIQTYIKQNGNEEITGEILQEILLSVVTTLGDSAINDLITALGNEVTARQQADGTLQQNITNEATARGNADTALGGRIDDEATARANGDTALSNRLGSTITAENTAADQIGAEAEARADADSALQNLIDGITNNIENGYVYAGIATPSSTPATGKVFYLALTAGTYTNFGNTEVSQGINILKYNGSAWSLDAFIGIDDTPTPNSPKLVKSGGVAEELALGAVYDVSAKNPTAGPNNDGKWESLSALLSDANLNTLIPTAVRKGGMSIKFVHTSDNKYVQTRYMSSSTAVADFTNVANWQGVDDEPTAGSENLVKSGGIKNYVDNHTSVSEDISNRTVDIQVGDETVELLSSNAIIQETIQSNTDEVLITDNNDNLIGKIDDSGADFKNLKSNGVDVITDVSDKASIAYVDEQLTLKQNSLEHLSETTTTSTDEEQVWGSDDSSEDYAKIGSYGVKAKSYLDIDGNDAVMPYINKIKHKNARFIFLGDLHYAGEDGHLDDEVPEEDLPLSMGEGHSIRYRFQHLVDALNAEHHKRPIDLVICTGDVIEGNRYESFVKEFVWQLQMPIVFSPGNHDNQAESYWIKYFGNRWQFGVETDDFVFVNWDNWNHIDITSGVVTPTYEQIYNRINTACATGKLVISFSHSEGGDMRNNLIAVAQLFPNYVAHVSGHTHSMRFLSYGTFKIINDGNFAYNGDGNYSLNDVRGLFGFNNIEVEDGKLNSWFIWPEYNYRKADFTMPFSEGTLVNDGDNYVVGSGLKNEIRSVSCESDDNLIQLYKLKDLYLKQKISINENR